MGVERAVTRWYIQRELLLNTTRRAESEPGTHKGYHYITDGSEQKCSDPHEGGQAQENALPQSPSSTLIAQLKEAQEKLRTLGPCPKPMMG